jgi:hypothetical protein
MAMSQEAEALLAEIHAEQAKYDETRQPPATGDDLAKLVKRSREELGVAPPEQYLDFLRGENGMNHNGLFIYGTATLPLVDDPSKSLGGLVETNLLLRDTPELRNYLIFGEGNQDLYGLHLETGEFRVIDRVPVENVEERHASFDALLAAAIRAHL